MLSINLPLLGLTVVLLALDYHREVERITAELTKKLDGDATLIGTAVSKMADGQCRVKVANFVADQCFEASGSGALSSGRVVNVSWNGSLLHGHTLPAMGER